jgi:hypothetical protein
MQFKNWISNKWTNVFQHLAIPVFHKDSFWYSDMTMVRYILRLYFCVFWKKVLVLGAPEQSMYKMRWTPNKTAYVHECECYLLVGTTSTFKILCVVGNTLQHGKWYSLKHRNNHDTDTKWWLCVSEINRKSFPISSWQNISVKNTCK